MRSLNLPERKQLLMITNTLSTFGGGERWALELAKRIRKRYDITIADPVARNSVVRMTYDRIRRDYGVDRADILRLTCVGIEQKAFGGEKFLLMVPSLSAVANLYRGIRRSDVIYILSLNPAIFQLSVRFAKMLNKRIILGVHNSFFDNFFKKAGATGNLYAGTYRAAFKDVSAFHTVNAEDKALILRHYPNAKVYVIPNFATFKAPVRRRAPVATRFTALFVGRLDRHHKGIDLLCETVNDVLAKNDKIQFSIVGSGGDGEPLVKRLAKQCRRNVEWKGFLAGQELAREYENASLFLFPSRFESFGLTLLEAQVNGLPAVAFDVKGPSTILSKPFQGTLVKNFSTSAFAKATCAYYDKWRQDPKSYYDARRKISAYALREYSDKRAVPKILAMLDAR